ncbi:diguanylate phosphodiesterase, partial [Pseudomonas syringae]
RDFIEQAMKPARGRLSFQTGAADGNQIYILVRLGNGVSGDYWALRVAPAALKERASQPTQDFPHLWRLEQRKTQRVILHEPVPATEAESGLSDTILLQPLSNSDWQLRGLFDTYSALSDLLPPLHLQSPFALLLSVPPLTALLSPLR